LVLRRNKKSHLFFRNDTLLKESNVIVINKNTFETIYGVATKPTAKAKTSFYFDKGTKNQGLPSASYQF